MTSNLDLTSLQKRLKDKIASDREQIEALTRSELEQLTESLKSAVNDTLHTIENDIKHRTAQVMQPLNQGLNHTQAQAEKLNKRLHNTWIKPLLVGLALFVGILGGSWGLIQYLIWEANSLQTEISQHRQTLAQLEKKTWGVEYYESKNGRFLIMPKGMTTESWTFRNGKQDGVRLIKQP